MFRLVQISLAKAIVKNNVRIGAEMSVALPKRGRPRAFDREQALRAAQALIWRHGYEAASLSQLEAAMGIGKTSLYAAFGSKFDLLREAARLYLAEAGAMIGKILDGAPTALAGLRSFLEICATDFTDPARPHGCFLVSAAIACSEENAEAMVFLREGRAAVGALVEARLRRGVKEGDLKPDSPVDALKEYLLTVLHGMSIQARDGRSARDLGGTVDLSMAALAPFAAGRQTH
jgi:AcrR family transcriptional regulator